MHQHPTMTPVEQAAHHKAVTRGWVNFLSPYTWDLYGSLTTRYAVRRPEILKHHFLNWQGDWEFTEAQKRGHARVEMVENDCGATEARHVGPWCNARKKSRPQATSRFFAVYEPFRDGDAHIHFVLTFAPMLAPMDVLIGKDLWINRNNRRAKTFGTADLQTPNSQTDVLGYLTKRGADTETLCFSLG